MERSYYISIQFLLYFYIVLNEGVQSERFLFQDIQLIQLAQFLFNRFIKLFLQLLIRQQLMWRTLLLLTLLLVFLTPSYQSSSVPLSQAGDTRYPCEITEEVKQLIRAKYEEADSEGHAFDQADLTNLRKVKQLIGMKDERVDEEGHAVHPADLSNLKKVLENNKAWSKEKIREDQKFFEKHVSSQKPQYLWIGCSDSRLNANEILGLDYGEVFVLRNVANIVSPSDISSLAVIQYAVEVLQVKDIIVAGHYNCGGVKAAVTKFNHGPLEAWLSKLRKIRHKHAHAFSHLETVDEKAKLLVEINVKEQVFNVASTPFVQQAWKNGQQLRIHGLVFSLQTGRLVDLNVTMHTLEQLPQQLAVVE